MSNELWRPTATLAMLRQRAKLLSNIRKFFHERNFLEVETPILGKFGVTDAYLRNLQTTFCQQAYFLQTSPEYHMKRLLAAGSGPIYQLARVFRDEELGRWHNPEFTLLEWYQLNINHHSLMDNLDEFLQTILYCQPLKRITYHDVFFECCGINPHLDDIIALRDVLKNFALEQVLPAAEKNRDQYLFLLMSHVVEPYLANSAAPIAVFDFPVTQAALAKINQQVKPPVAERFEVYYAGVELANGFHELTDSKLQHQRFASDNALRLSNGMQTVTEDEYLLHALDSGLPACSGVALGVDRLCALANNKSAISECLAFDFSRA